MLHDYKWWLKEWVTTTRAGAKTWGWMRPKSSRFFVKEDTDLVIEGYPRSGNTFFVALVTYKSERKLEIARHRHETGQLVRASQLLKPAFLVLREPLNAVSSFVVREGVSIRFALQYYIYYHSKLEKHADGLHLIPFDVLVSDPGGVLLYVESNVERARFSKYRDSDLPAVQNLVVEMERRSSGGEVKVTHVAVPSDERQKRKSRLYQYIVDDFSSLYVAARGVHERLLQAARLTK